VRTIPFLVFPPLDSRIILSYFLLLEGRGKYESLLEEWIDLSHLLPLDGEFALFSTPPPRGGRIKVGVKPINYVIFCHCPDFTLFCHCEQA